MNGAYSINNPRRLFEKLVRSFTAFCESPSGDGILDVVFPLYHLREWICLGGYDSYKHKPGDARTREELLHAHFHEMPQYEVLRSLCNAAKHYSAETLAGRTEILEGFHADLGRAGDSLGVMHFLVDGQEIRDLFWPVYMVYFDYFRAAQPGSQPDAAR